MKKNSTNKLLTWDFGRMCAANLLLFASVYLLLPLLPVAMAERLGTSGSEAGRLYLLFAAGMLAVGPFHAWLGDTYKRKGVLLLSTLGMLLAALGYAFATNLLHWMLLALVQGACFGLAVTAGITVAIDITTSARRTAGNRAYAWAARMGVLAGVGGVAVCCAWMDFRSMVYASVACGLLSLLLASRVYVAFRAPIGMPLLNIDRFLLPLGWMPFLNLALVAFVPGLLLPLLPAGSCGALIGVAVLLFLTVPFTKMFVRLSHHCQRGTANTTCHLAMEAGLLLGMATTCLLCGTESSLAASWETIRPWVCGIGLLAFLLLTPTYLYYKRKRVR